MAPSDKQTSFLNSLLRDRDVPESLKVEAEAVRDHGDRRDVSAMIDRLKACPFKGRTEQRGGAPKVTEPGVYRGKDGLVYVVKPTRATAKLPREEQRFTASKAVEIGGTRVTGAGTFVNVEFEYAAGAVYDLDPADRVPFAEAKALTARYGRCIVCGAHLKAAKSVERGIGPVCRTYFPDAGEDVDTKGAAKTIEEAVERSTEVKVEPVEHFDEEALEAKVKAAVEWAVENRKPGECDFWARFGAFCGTIEDSITRENKEAILRFINEEQAASEGEEVSLTLVDYATA